MRTYRAEAFFEDGLSMHVFHSTTDSPCSEHTHDFVEIIYALDGISEQIIDGVKRKMKVGDLLFINYGCTHAFLPDGKFSFINICFQPEIVGQRIITRENAFDLLSLTAISDIQSNTDDGGVISFDKKERVLFEALLKDMLDEYEAREPERNAVLESYMTILIAKLLRKIRPEEKNSENKSDIWAKLSEYISDNLDKKLSLSDMAGMCFYNPSYFSRAFKEKFGTPLIDYISKERAALAAKLLITTDLTTQEISSKCGYGDKSSLYRTFSKFFGITPQEYRAKHKDNASS